MGIGEETRIVSVVAGVRFITASWIPQEGWKPGGRLYEVLLRKVDVRTTSAQIGDDEPPVVLCSSQKMGLAVSAILTLTWVVDMECVLGEVSHCSDKVW